MRLVGYGARGAVDKLVEGHVPAVGALKTLSGCLGEIASENGGAVIGDRGGVYSGGILGNEIAVLGDEGALCHHGGGVGNVVDSVTVFVLADFNLLRGVWVEEHRMGKAGFRVVVCYNLLVCSGPFTLAFTLGGKIHGIKAGRDLTNTVFECKICEWGGYNVQTIRSI